MPCPPVLVTERLAFLFERYVSSALAASGGSMTIVCDHERVLAFEPVTVAVTS